MTTASRDVPAPTDLAELPGWARDLAEHHLVERVPDRWAQTIAALRIARRHLDAVGNDRDLFLAAVAIGNLGWDPELQRRHRVSYQPLAAAAALRELRAPERLVNLQLHMIGGATEARLRGVEAAYADIPDEIGPTRDALWACYLAVAPGGTPLPLDVRMADAHVRYANDPVVLSVINEVFADYAATLARAQTRVHP